MFYQIEMPGINTMVELSDEDLFGTVAAATAIFDNMRDQNIRISDQGGRKLDLDAVLANNGVVVLDGEGAFEAGSGKGTWLNRLKSYGAKPTKKYTVALHAPEGEASHIVQFNTPQFLISAAQMYKNLNLVPNTHITNLHEGNKKVDILTLVQQKGGSQFYRIEVPSKGIDQDLALSEEALAGIAAAATSIYGDNRDQMIRIANQAGRLVNLSKLLKDTKSVVSDGEAAFETGSGNGTWIEQIMGEIESNGKGSGTGKVTKTFTIKLGGGDGTHIVQFDNPEFFKGLVQMYRVAGLNPADQLVGLHEGETELDVNKRIKQHGGKRSYTRR
jgi:hypothetical protein